MTKFNKSAYTALFSDHEKKMHRVLTTFILLAIAACSERPATTYDPPLKFENRTYADWSAEWWKWAMSNPDEISPLHDRSGANCAVGQQGNIWFLAGGFGSSKIKRRCTIPAGKHIFFPVINMAYWSSEPNNGYTCELAKERAAINNDSAIDLFVEIDGLPIAEPKRFRAITAECFDIFDRIPANQKPYDAFPSASDGYWILLAPLAKGSHIIKFGGRYANSDTAYGGMIQDIEYELLVE